MRKGKIDSAGQARHKGRTDVILLHAKGGNMSYFAARHAQTTLACPECEHKLEVARTCHEAFMRCPFCGKRFPLEQFISQADEVMERFLENLYFDRV